MKRMSVMCEWLLIAAVSVFAAWVFAEACFGRGSIIP